MRIADMGDMAVFQCVYLFRLIVFKLNGAEDLKH